MYVEINGRRTGKTTRMVEDIVNFLETNRDKNALVIAPDNGSRKRLKELIFEKCGFGCLNRTITSHKMLTPNLNTMKQYVDEFFYLPEKYLVVDKNAYYTGTPREEYFSGLYQEIHKVFQEENGSIVTKKPLKRHGFGGNN
jgi:hypothetical protein